MRGLCKCATYFMPELHWLSLTDCIDEFARIMQDQVILQHVYFPRLLHLLCNLEKKSRYNELRRDSSSSAEIESRLVRAGTVIPTSSRLARSTRNNRSRERKREDVALRSIKSYDCLPRLICDWKPRISRDSQRTF